MEKAKCIVKALLPVSHGVQVLRCAVEGPIFDEHTFSCIGVELGSGQVSVPFRTFVARLAWGFVDGWLNPQCLCPIMALPSLFPARNPRHCASPLLLQVIRCQQLAAAQPFLQEWLATFRLPTLPSAVHHCVAVLDAPLVPGEQQSLLVLPPGALGSGVPAVPAAHVVRGLALSASTKACPPDRCGG